MSYPPVFLFGFDRSGTTLLSMVVGAHGQLAVPFSVTGLWYRYGQRLADYRDLDGPAAVARLVDDLLDEERIRLWDADLARAELLAGLPPRDYPRLMARFHEVYARVKRKPRWANIDIATLDHMDLAHRWFPDARFVHIVRDGRDVALSHRHYPYGAGNLSDCARGWRHRVHANLKMGAMIGPERYLVIRYEDLVLDFQVTVRRLCAFLAVDYDPALASYHTTVAARIPEDRRWLWPVIDQPPVKSRVYQWRQKLRTHERVLFEELAGDVLATLGYETYPRSPRSLLAEGLGVVEFLGRGRRFGRLRRRLARVLTGRRRAANRET